MDIYYPCLIVKQAGLSA